MDLLLYLALVPTLGVTAQWLAWGTQLPGILLLLVFGVVLGLWVQPDAYLAEVTGGNATSGPNILFPLVSLSVAIIMFEGGLTLNLHSLLDAAKGVRRLVFIGAPVGWLTSALTLHYGAGLGWEASAVFGGIMIVLKE